MNDYSTIAESIFQINVRGAEEWMVKCIFHDGSGASLQFNIKTGLYYCFNCHAKGNIKSLQKFIGQRFADLEVDVADIVSKLDALEKQSGKSLKMPVINESALRNYKFPTKYWASRGFTPETIKIFDLGYNPLENEAMIPIRNVSGELVGFIRRLLDKDAVVRYMYPKGFHRKTSLFASWLIAKSLTDEVCITEGAVDAMTLWQIGVPAVAQYGSSISREQVMLLRRLGINRITFFYDNDKAGESALQVALPITKDFLIKTVEYKRGDPKDANCFDGATLKKRISAARLVE